MIIETISTITAFGLQDLRARDKKHLLIDIRDLDETEEGMIPGAWHIPACRLYANFDRYGVTLHAPIILYCETGRRSGQACWKLRCAGYQNVRSLDGGYESFRLDAQTP